MTDTHEDILRLKECPECTYDLAALAPPRRCPECGFAYGESMFLLPVTIRGKSRKVLFKHERSLNVFLVFVLLAIVGLVPNIPGTAWNVLYLLLPLTFLYWWVVLPIAKRLRRESNVRLLCNAKGIALEISGKWSNVLPYEEFSHFHLKVSQGEQHSLALKTCMSGGLHFHWVLGMLHASPDDAERVRLAIVQRIHEAKNLASHPDSK